MSTINRTAHGLTAGERVNFASITPASGTGIDTDTIYFVIAAGLTADAFQISETQDGAAVTILTPITDATMQVVPETTDGDPSTVVYVAEAADAAVMYPPLAVGAVTDLVLDSDTIENADGSTIVRLIITFTPPTEDKLRACYVQVSFVDDNDPVAPQPIWDENAIIYTVPAGENTLAIDGVAGNTPYYVRAWAADVYGQMSAATAAQNILSVKDPSAPAIPVGIVLLGTARGLFVKWSATTAKDLAFYELRYAIDIGTGLGPNTAEWVVLRLKTTSAYIGALEAVRDPVTGVGASRYWVQVRAVDSSGNVDDGTGAAFDFLGSPETGWTTAVSADTTLTGGGDIDFGALTDDHIVANGLSAGVIKTGDLRINTSDANMVDGIKVYDAGVLVGLWNESGLYVYDSADPTNYVRLYEGGVSVFLGGVEVSAITPDGINASALSFGKLPGGHNVILNSSFELADFGSAPTAVSWNVQADWDGTDVSVVNLTHGANSITATTLAY